MLWLVLALISAASIATVDALTKRFLSHLTVFEMAAARLSFSLPLFLILLFFIPVPHLDTTFYLTVLLALPLEITAFFLYMRAIQASPLSLAIPFLSFTPVFLILTGRLILGEELSARGILGIISVVLGSYVLNLRECKNGFLGPFGAIKREKGSWLMLMWPFYMRLPLPWAKRPYNTPAPFFLVLFTF
ncbi:MAG: DMT family transporter [Thermodesulfobacteriota bacterium]|nr:DMT family transporter [Thermodesulfobacteriota bacterium]